MNCKMHILGNLWPSIGCTIEIRYLFSLVITDLFWIFFLHVSKKIIFDLFQINTSHIIFLSLKCIPIYNINQFCQPKFLCAVSLLSIISVILSINASKDGLSKCNCNLLFPCGCMINIFIAMI